MQLLVLLYCKVVKIWIWDMPLLTSECRTTSPRSSKDVQQFCNGIDGVQRCIQRLLLQASLSSSSASTSSYAASKLLKSEDQSRIIEWLRNAGDAIDEEESTVPSTPTIVVGIDIGMTCKSLAQYLG
jgi:hypothetical protein